MADYVIRHTAGAPGTRSRDQVCVRCYRILRLRGSRDMFRRFDVVGECRDRGQLVLVPNPPDGVSCLAHQGGPAC